MKIIAHRSGPTVFPEQTIRSALFAKENGADLVEIDVRFTKDEKLAVSHDENAARVFGVDKNIGEMSGDEFAALRHKNARTYTSHFLEDYMESGVGPLLIHVKEDEVLDALLESIENHDYLHKVVLGVQSPEAVKKVKAYDSTIKVLGFLPDVESISAFGETQADAIRLIEGWLNADTAQRVRQYGKELWIMTWTPEVGLTTPENLKKIHPFHPDALLINDVTMLRS